jgi:autotransporter-associated beta strand protein
MYHRVLRILSLVPLSAGCRWFHCALVSAAAVWAFPVTAPAYDQHFDYTSFENSTGKHFQQAQFNVLNYASMNGNYMMTSTDNHRPEMVAHGNALAQFYNNFNADYNHPTAERRTPAEEAAFIHNYVTSNSTKNGPRPEWLILNEISASQWQLNPGVPSKSEHRTWVIDTVTLLNDEYGYKVITYSPYETVGSGNAASWQALAAKSYIAIESYQSGTEVWNSGSTNAARLAWAQSKYQNSKNTYLAAGVPASRLFVSEHFGNNNAVTDSGAAAGWGRAGLASAAAWDTVIQLRQDAIYNVGFAGFLAYSWGGNGMEVTEAEQIQHEYYYRSRLVLPGQKPQWLSDSAINVNGTSIPLSWSQPLNWLGGVPNTSGAEVNFWRTLSANRTVTLDGNKSAGRLTFDSPYSYTIAPGSGGALVLNNSASAATLTSSQGNHTVAANVQLVSSLNAAINTGTFTVSGEISGNGGLIKQGAGTLALANANAYLGNTTVEEGTLRMNGRFLPDTTAVLLSSGASLQLNYTGSPDIVDSLLIDGVAQYPGIWGPLGSVAQYTTSLLTGTGVLQVTDGPPPGDFNGDGSIDSADYVLWRKNVGSDPDYSAWRKNFGIADTGGSLGNSGLLPKGIFANVPEPATGSVFLIGIVALLLYWPHGRHRLRALECPASGGR